MSMGETAENVAKRYQITRDDQEEFAVRSHAKAAAAQAAGKFADEIVPIRRNGEVDRAGRLHPPRHQQGGAGGPEAGVRRARHGDRRHLLAADRRRGRGAGVHRGLRRRSTASTCSRGIKSVAVAGCAAEIMGIGPVAATRKALARAGLEIGDIELVELNEAFASQAIACVRDLMIDPETLNIDGGALALGHPLGATGARITGKAAAIMKRDGRRYALATQCIGGGQGIATVLEAI